LPIPRLQTCPCTPVLLIGSAPTRHPPTPTPAPYPTLFRSGNKRAASAIRVMERLSFMLSAAQVGITVTGLLVGFIAQPAFVDVIDPALSAVGVPDVVVSGLAVAIGFG